mmetsp:Transcript_4283/g.7623  ORF Transcript_4283/g.7623 Transcript_4283/m.7623 type:complete len:115 (+) Transcript_4283:157-501(+)
MAALLDNSLEQYSSSDFTSAALLSTLHLISGEDGINVSKLLVDHKSKNTHLSGTSIVQLNGTLSPLRIIAQLVPSKVKGTVTEVSFELSWAITKRILVSSPGGSILILVGGLHH